MTALSPQPPVAGAGRSRWAWVGPTVCITLVALAFIRVGTRTIEATSSDLVLTMAHTNLQPGVREAYDELIRVYQERNPDVRIEQLGIPIRVYSSWLQAQLVGGTAPDLIEIRHGQRNEFLARYFVPLTTSVQQPNPYNVGTALADLRWRDTFLDGLQNDPNFIKGLLEYYSIPGTVRTYRLVVNRELYERVTGRVDLPTTLDEYLEISRAAKAWRGPRGERIVPLAAGGWAGFQLLDRAFRLATQRAYRELDFHRQGGGTEEDLAAVGLAGAWSLDTEAVRVGLTLMAGLAEGMLPGFWQTPVADVHFNFLQGQSLFVVASSQEFTAIRDDASFPLELWTLPDPDPTMPPFDELMMGEAGEGFVPTMASLGLTRQSRHAAQAIDFLQFISSVEGNRIFSENTGWMPAVDGVKPPGHMAAFQPRRAGINPGFSLWLSHPEVHRHLWVNLHHLVEQDGSAARFVAAIEGEYTTRLAGSLARQSQTQGEISARLDSAMAVMWWREAQAEAMAREDLVERQLLLDETQVGAEARQLFYLAASRAEAGTTVESQP